MKRVQLNFIIGLMGCALFAQENLSKDNIDSLSIYEAIQKSYIDVKVFGAYDNRFYQETIDSDGVHYGKCMLYL